MEQKRQNTATPKGDEVPDTYFSPNFTGQETLSEASMSNLGTLNSLPIELIHIVLCSLDTVSFLRFRAVSRLASTLASNMPEYHVFDSRCLVSIRRIIRWKLGVTISDVYRGLMSPHCIECKQLTPHLFLYSAVRICIDCTELPQDHFVPTDAIKELSHSLLSDTREDIVSYLPELVFPEAVSLEPCDSQLVTKGSRFAPANEAIKVLIDLGGNRDMVKEEVDKIRGVFRRREHLLLAFPSFSADSGRVEQTH